MAITESNIQNHGTGIMKEGEELIHEMNESEPAFGESAIWWLGQIGFAVKLAGRIFYLDAFLSQHPNRKIPSLLKPEEVTNADYFFGSHDHTDHIDRKVWHQLSVSSPNAKFIVSKLLIPSLSNDLNIKEERFIGLDDGITLKLLDDIRMTGIAAAHEFLDQDPATGAYPYLGCVLEGGGCSLYHSGDTCIYEGMYDKLRKFGKLDVMFLPINGRDGRRYRENIIGNMTYQEAADMAGTFRPGLAVPAHYEMFDKNSEDPLLFADYLTAKYPGINYWIGRHGERILVKR